MLVDAREAARFTGYRTERRFRAAVSRGVMPGPLDARAKPQLWSEDQLAAAMRGEYAKANDDDPIMARINAINP